MVKIIFFKKDEAKFLAGLFLVLIFIIGLNLRISLRKGRDNVRKSDMGAIQKIAETYQEKYGMFPKSSEDGKIVGCFDGSVIIDEKTNRPTNAVICNWGELVIHLNMILPKDPDFGKGASYLYQSDGEKYVIYSSLEGKNEDEYNKKIEDLNLQCGTRTCNYMRAY